MANLKTMVYKNGNKLNDSEKQIIQFVLNNPKLCSSLSLSKLSKKLYVSESAIFRLCKKLGLSGYSELKFNLEELARQEERNITAKNNFPEELASGINEVQKYFKSLDLNKLFQDISKANNIYIYSTGWQEELIAQYFSHELFMVGQHTTVLPSALDELRAISSYAKAGDLLFIISYSGDNTVINEELVKLELTNDKFKYVSFTNLKQNKLALLAEYNFYYPTIVFSKDSEFSDGKTAFTPAYYLIDLLVSEYCVWKKNHEEGE